MKAWLFQYVFVMEIQHYLSTLFKLYMYACIFFFCILCPLWLPFKLDWGCGSCGLQSVPGRPAVLQSWQEKEEEEKAEAMWSRMDDSKTNKEGRRRRWLFLFSLCPNMKSQPCVHTSWADCTWPDAPIGRGRPSLSVGIHSFIMMTGQCDFLVVWILSVSLWGFFFCLFLHYLSVTWCTFLSLILMTYSTKKD